MKPEKIREGLYIKKDKFGYKIVYPYKNTDGTINWFNVMTGGSWYNLIKVCIIVLLIVGMSWSYYHDTKACRDLMANPCDILPTINTYCQELWHDYPLLEPNITVKGNLQYDNWKFTI